MAYKGVHSNPTRVVDSMKEDEGEPNIILSSYDNSLNKCQIPWQRFQPSQFAQESPDLMCYLPLSQFLQILLTYHEILNRKKLLILSIFVQSEHKMFHITLSYPIMSHSVSPLKNIAVSSRKCRKYCLREIKFAKFPGGV